MNPEYLRSRVSIISNSFLEPIFLFEVSEYLAKLEIEKKN